MGVQSVELPGTKKKNRLPMLLTVQKFLAYQNDVRQLDSKVSALIKQMIHNDSAETFLARNVDLTVGKSIAEQVALDAGRVKALFRWFFAKYPQKKSLCVGTAYQNLEILRHDAKVHKIM